MCQAVAAKGEMELQSPLQIPPVSLLHTYALQVGWCSHIWNLIAVGMWSFEEERLTHKHVGDEGNSFDSHGHQVQDHWGKSGPHE